MTTFAVTVTYGNRFHLLKQVIDSACSLIDENSKDISTLWVKQDDFKYSFAKLIFGNTVTGCTVLFKKELLKDAFPIPTGEKYHDW